MCTLLQTPEQVYETHRRAHREQFKNRAARNAKTLTAVQRSGLDNYFRPDCSPVEGTLVRRFISVKL